MKIKKEKLRSSDKFESFRELQAIYNPYIVQRNAKNDKLFIVHDGYVITNLNRIKIPGAAPHSVSVLKH